MGVRRFKSCAHFSGGIFVHYDWKTTALIVIFLWFIGTRIWSFIAVPNRSRCLHLIFISSNTKNIEQLLHWNKLCLSWDFFLGKGKVLLIDMESSDEQKQIISQFLIKHPSFSLCDYENITDELSKEQFNQVRVIF